MFVVLLKFAVNRARAGELMQGHKDWLARGFDDGVFLVSGNLHPGLGGAVVAHNTSREALQRRVDADPFVAENVVSAEIIEIAPGRTDTRLSFIAA